MFRLNRCFFVILALGSLSAQDARPAILAWQNVYSRYASFKEIKPTLVNNGQRSVFLSRIWPHGSAQLERLNEATGNWESGSWSGGCGTVSKAIVPIEIKPRAERKVQVYWQLSADDWDNPKHFEVETAREERPIEGRYRFVLRYSMEPWTLVQQPSSIYMAVSPEFIVSP